MLNLPFYASIIPRNMTLSPEKEVSSSPDLKEVSLDPIVEQQSEWRRSILKSIFERGLLSGWDVRKMGLPLVLGMDFNWPRPDVYARINHPHMLEPEDVYSRSIHNAFYRSHDSIMTIISERPDDGGGFSSQAGDRGLNSLLIIGVLPRKERKHLRVLQIGRIKLEYFRYLISPPPVSEDIRMASEQLPLSIHETTGILLRHQETSKEKYPFPDYETPLKDILFREETSLWIHAVRLPTYDDVVRRNLTLTPQAES